MDNKRKMPVTTRTLLVMVGKYTGEHNVTEMLELYHEYMKDIANQDAIFRLTRFMFEFNFIDTPGLTREEKFIAIKSAILSSMWMTELDIAMPDVYSNVANATTISELDAYMEVK